MQSSSRYLKKVHFKARIYPNSFPLFYLREKITKEPFHPVPGGEGKDNVTFFPVSPFPLSQLVFVSIKQDFWASDDQEASISKYYFNISNMFL